MDEDRPRCACGNFVLKIYRKGVPTGYRKICSSCNSKGVAERQGLTPFEYHTKCLEAGAKKRGLSVAQYRNKSHKYRKYIGSECSNRDGHLGYKCTFPKTFGVVEGLAVLEADHKDGNPKNNDPSNITTYCPSCHRVKTYMNSDHTTPGRKSK